MFPDNMGFEGGWMNDEGESVVPIIECRKGIKEEPCFFIHSYVNT